MSRDDFGDVVYEVWRRGGNADAIDRERAEEDLRYGDRAEDVADAEIRRQDRRQAQFNVGVWPDQGSGEEV